MDIIIEFGKILLPAALVLYAMYLSMKAMLARDIAKANIDYKIKSSKEIMPNRIQAFERMVLFLERIAPGNLLVRLNTGKLTARELQHVMIAEIREEYNHNLSQQLYISEEVWQMIKNTVEDIIAIINTSAAKLDGEAKSVELAKLIFTEMEKRDVDPVQETLKHLKAEFREIL